MVTPRIGFAILLGTAVMLSLHMLRIRIGRLRSYGEKLPATMKNRGIRLREIGQDAMIGTSALERKISGPSVNE